MITNFNSNVSAKILQTGNGSEAELDVTELHGKIPGSATMKRGSHQTPARSPAKGLGSDSAMGIGPQQKHVIHPVKSKTQSNHRPRKYREHQSKGCVDKIRYGSHAEAYDVIRGMVRNKSKKRAFRSLKSYPCRNCHGWHIHSI